MSIKSLIIILSSALFLSAQAGSAFQHLPLTPQMAADIEGKFFEVFHSLPEDEKLMLVTNALAIKEKLDNLPPHQRMAEEDKLRKLGYPPPPTPAMIRFFVQYRDEH